MRVRADEPAGLHYEAYLDGRRVPCCIEADDEAGYVIVRQRHGWTGDVESGLRAQVRDHRLYGRVELRRLDQ